MEAPWEQALSIWSTALISRAWKGGWHIAGAQLVFAKWLGYINLYPPTFIVYLPHEALSIQRFKNKQGNVPIPAFTAERGRCYREVSQSSSARGEGANGVLGAPPHPTAWHWGTTSPGSQWGGPNLCDISSALRCIASSAYRRQGFRTDPRRKIEPQRFFMPCRWGFCFKSSHLHRSLKPFLKFFHF